MTPFSTTDLQKCKVTNLCCYETKSLCLKEATDKELLSKIIKNNFGSEEFFINKAIGWALREYSKTNPDWVKNFIETNKDKMTTLSIKEGLKIINKKNS